MTAFITVALTYFQLAVEDHRWLDTCGKKNRNDHTLHIHASKRAPHCLAPTDPPPPQRWWWRSFLCGGSTGIFIYGYCFYYYFVRSDMSGLMQTSFYFGYNAVVCYAFFLMLGSVGFNASLLFVRHIYRCVDTVAKWCGGLGILA